MLANRRPHAVIMVQNLPVPFDRRVWQEAQTLHAHGYEVDVICPSGAAFPRGVHVLDGVTVHRYPATAEGRGLFGYVREYANAAFWQFIILLRVAFHSRIDVIHGCNPPDFLLLIAYPVAVIRRAKLIFDHHDVCP